MGRGRGGVEKKPEQQNLNFYNPSDKAQEFHVLELFNFPYQCCLAWITVKYATSGGGYLSVIMTTNRFVIL